MDRSKSEDLPNDTFFRRPIFKANCIIGIEKIRQNCLDCDYEVDKILEVSREFVSCFGHLRKVNILHPYLSQTDFRSESDGNQTT